MHEHQELKQRKKVSIKSLALTQVTSYPVHQEFPKFVERALNQSKQGLMQG